MCEIRQVSKSIVLLSKLLTFSHIFPTFLAGKKANFSPGNYKNVRPAPFDSAAEVSLGGSETEGG